MRRDDPAILALQADWAAELERRKAEQTLPLDALAFLERASWYDRNRGPALLLDAYIGGELAPGALAGVLVSVWSGAEFPERLLPRRLWLGWFRAADYRRPAGPLTVYRGAVARYARGMAWTTNPSRADWFASRWGTDLELDPFLVAYGTPDEQAAERRRLATAVERAAENGHRLAHVYAATVEPAGILAVVDDLEPGGRREEEVIVDPAYLSRPVRRDPARPW